MHWNGKIIFCLHSGAPGLCPPCPLHWYATTSTSELGAQLDQAFDRFSDETKRISGLHVKPGGTEFARVLKRNLQTVSKAEKLS